MKRLLCILLLAGSLQAAKDDPFTSVAPKPEFQELQSSSLYVPMKDGTRIALDVVLPKGLPPERKLPTVLKITRYGRASVDGKIDFITRFFVSRGYARVLMDERGTGASFGTVRYGKPTLGDIREVVDWIVRQPWSNGRVAATGGSYEGTTSELLAAIDHPAVRAVAPLYSDFNYYTDLLYSGGVFNDLLIKTWSDLTAQMDAGASAKRVDTDKDGTLLKQAVAQHPANLNVYDGSRHAPFIDDVASGMGGAWLDISITGVRAELEKSRVPMMIFASWYDAATVQGTIERFQTFSNIQRVFIGAWNHGGGRDGNPFLPQGTPPVPGQVQQTAEVLHFFDHFLKDAPDETAGKRQFYYFTIGENAWHATDTWPPQGLHTTIYHLTGDHTLREQAGEASVQVELPVISTGEQNRWGPQVSGGDVHYDNVMSKLNSLPQFTSAPLSAALEITGQPVLRLHLACAESDPAVFAYLVAVDPNGKSVFLTDGELRLVDRKLNADEQTLHSYFKRDSEPVPQGKEFEADFTLFPLSAVVPEGWRLRILLAAGDSPQFGAATPYKAIIFSSSQLELPSKMREKDTGRTK